MKTILANLVIIIFIALAYWSDIFSLFAHKGAIWIALILVAGVFGAAFKILGNPFKGKEKDHDEDN